MLPISVLLMALECGPEPGSELFIAVKLQLKLQPSVY